VDHEQQLFSLATWFPTQVGFMHEPAPASSRASDTYLIIFEDLLRYDKIRYDKICLIIDCIYDIQINVDW
jgi:hypothetical protein